MDSKPRVSLFDTKANPDVITISSPPSSTSTGFLPIRAPITLDDDESGFEPNGYMNEDSDNSSSYSSGSGFQIESEGFVSGEEFETASERHFVGDPDEETVEETGVYAKYDISRPFVPDPGESWSEYDTEEEEGRSAIIDGCSPVVDNPNLKLAMPIARLSMDEFDELLGDEGILSEVEDGELEIVVKVPELVVKETTDAPARVKVLQMEKGAEDEPMELKDSSFVIQSEEDLSMKVADGVISGNFVEVHNGVVGSDNTVGLSEDDPQQGSKEDVLEENFKIKEDACFAVKESRPLENMEYELNDLNCVDRNDIETTWSDINSHPSKQFVESKLFEGCASAIHVKEQKAVVTGNCMEHSLLGIELHEASETESFDNVAEGNEMKMDVFEVSGPNPARENGELHEVVEGKTVEDALNGVSSPVEFITPISNLNHEAKTECVEKENDNSDKIGGKEGVLSDQCIEELIFATSTRTLQDTKEVGQTEVSTSLLDPEGETESLDDVAEGNEMKMDVFEVSGPIQTQENGEFHEVVECKTLEDALNGVSSPGELITPISNLDQDAKAECVEKENHSSDKIGGKEGVLSDEYIEELIFATSTRTLQYTKEVGLTEVSTSLLDPEGCQYVSGRIDQLVLTDADEEANIDGDDEVNKFLYSATLEALLKAVTNAEMHDGSISADGSELISLKGPADLSSSFQSGISTPLNSMIDYVSKRQVSEEEKKRIAEIQLMTVRFLRLVWRLGLSHEDPMVVHELDKLTLAVGTNLSQAFDLESAKRMAIELEGEGKDDLGIQLNILVLGKTGVGKSATINSIFGEKKVTTDAFAPATTNLTEIVGMVDGIKIRILDTPGLRSSATEEAINQNMLASTKKYIKKFPPDVVLYVDRLDACARDTNDLSLLKSLTNSLGSSIWKKAIVSLTHATSAPVPDGPSGSPLSFEAFVTQRSAPVKQAISQAVGHLFLTNPNTMDNVSLVENHPTCFKNCNGESVLPNGECWRPQLLLLCYSLKILTEASSLSKRQDTSNHRKPFGFGLRPLHLPNLVSSLLQSWAHPKLSTDQGGEIIDLDTDVSGLSDFDEEVEDEYGRLPPFKPLRKSLVSKLDNEQRKAYFEDYDYRVKLLQKKQWGNEVKRLKELKRFKEIEKKGENGAKDYEYMDESVDREDGSPPTVAFPSFESNDLEPSSQLLMGPVLGVMKWKGDLGLMANLQCQFPIGRTSKMAVQVGLNSNRSGQIKVKVGSLEQFQIVVLGILPIAVSIFRSMFPGS